MRSNQNPHLLKMLGMISFIFTILFIGVFSIPVLAQTATPIAPVPYTPGVPLRQVITTTPNPNVCLTPLNLETGDLIFIKSGVNIRNMPSQSGALVWNTVYDNYDEDGALQSDQVSVPATVVEGPVCSEGYNWWRVTGTENPGWVAEGRADTTYFIIALDSQPDIVTCNSTTAFNIGQTITTLYNARVREAPSLASLTKTVVPAETPILITGGSQCVEGIKWFPVQATVADFTYQGWMAEGANANSPYLIDEADIVSSERGNLCSVPLSFNVGDRGYVNYSSGGAKSLRATPGTDGTLLFSLVNGVPFMIESESVCIENLNWWKITVLASTPVTGWMAEGSSGIGYWMSELRPYSFGAGQ